MAHFTTIATDASEFTSTLALIKEERKAKQELISSTISKATTWEEFLKVATAYADANKLDLFTYDRSGKITKMVSNTFMQNETKFLAFIKEKTSHIAQAQICVYKDSGLWRIEYCGSPTRIPLGYSDLNSPTWFTKLSITN